ncbi:MAG: hypothetical protein ACHQ52_07660 [Candidatus Eisenbacteria bacterium]
MRRSLAGLAFLVLLHPISVSAAPAAGSEVDAWHADLQTLTRELPNRHPAPFLQVSHARWDSAAASLDRRLPTLSRNQILVGVMQLVAMLGDAHTAVEPDSSLGLRFYPLELYAFEDGLFVRRTDPAHAGLLGARVLRVGRVTAQQAMDSVATVIPHENEWWARAWAPFWITVPEVLDGLGLASDVERLPLVVERGGRVDTAWVEPAGRIADHHGEGPMPIDMDAWPTMRSAPAPWWELHADQVFWWNLDRPSGTLYVCQRAVVPSPRSATNRSQWDQLFALADSVRPTRMVIDLRENGGGNGALNRYPVQQILRRPWLDRPDRLFVIIGRRTFSAAQQFTNLLEAWTQATLVGEPTGQRPSQYGDHRPLVLHGGRLTVQISTVFHQAPNEFDTRHFVPPALYTPLDSKSYRDGIDPAIATVLHPDTAATVSEVIERALAAGDTAAAERALQAARDKTVNRFHSIERDVNAIGYRLLAAGQTMRAIEVLRMNTRAYPRSANTFDSLGEALLAAGWHDAAVAAYQRALEVEPGFPPSLGALRRLGAHE